MVIDSRKTFGAAAALTLVGALVWGSSMLFAPPAEPRGSVEIAQIPERGWAVEVKDLGASETAKPVLAAAHR